eukprot:800375-Pyramimonas_sp.AAC.1
MFRAMRCSCFVDARAADRPASPNCFVLSQVCVRVHGAELWEAVDQFEFTLVDDTIGAHVAVVDGA